MTLARSWEAAQGFPPEVAAAPIATTDPALQGLYLHTNRQLLPIDADGKFLLPVFFIPTRHNHQLLRLCDGLNPSGAWLLTYPLAFPWAILLPTPSSWAI